MNALKDFLWSIGVATAIMAMSLVISAILVVGFLSVLHWLGAW
jgi:hypothetical protein